MIGEKVSKTIDFFAEDNKYRQSPQFPVKQKVTDGVMFYHCKRHDYMYYPEPVTNEEGVRYRAGYYDETGKYYSELKLYHSFPEEGLVCKYCGHCVTEDEFTEMEALKCPNCDASFELLTPADVVKKDKVVMSEVRFTDKPEAEARRYVREAEVIEKTRDRKRAAYDPEYNQDYDEDLFYEEEGSNMQAEWVTDLLGLKEDREKSSAGIQPIKMSDIILAVGLVIAMHLMILFACLIAHKVY